MDDDGAGSATVRFVHLPARENFVLAKYSELWCKTYSNRSNFILMYTPFLTFHNINPEQLGKFCEHE